MSKCGVIFLFVLTGSFWASSTAIENDSVSKKGGIITEVVNLDESIINSDIADALLKFKLHQNDIEVIGYLSAHQNELIEYTENKLTTNLSLSEILLLMQSLSVVNDERATNALVSIGLQYTGNVYLQANLLKLITELPETDKSSSYLSDLVKYSNKSNLNTLRATLLAMSMNESSNISRLASYYRSPGTASDIRFVGLYMSSLLGKDKTLKRWILKVLLAENRPPAFQHYYLLIALSRQMSDVEFNDFLSRSYASKVVINSVKAERIFYQGDAATRLKLTSNLINSNYADQRNTAISFLLEEKGFEKTWQRLNQQQRLSAVRLSYRLNIPFASPNIDESFGDNYLWYVFTLGVIGLIIFVGFRSSKL